MKLLGNRILVKVIPPPDKVGSIHIPNVEGLHREPSRGIVVSVTSMYTDAEPGDTVLYQEYAGIDIQYKGALHKILEPKNLLAVLTKI